MLPKLAGAVKKAMLATGINVFIANGGVAGQQAGHFLFHIIARETEDKVSKFNFKSNEIPETELTGTNSMLLQNIPIMMNNHFGRNPAGWHNGQIKTADYLNSIKSESIFIYEDEKALCVSPKKPVCKGHMVIYSQDEEQDIEKLDFDTSSHLFFVASFCATAAFEGLKAHGSNIILKSGVSDDNPDGKLALHVFPRYQDDGLDFLNQPLSKKPDLKSIASKIKDKTFMIEYELKNKKEEKAPINLDELKKPIQIIADKPEEVKEEKPEDEIASAISKIINQ